MSTPERKGKKAVSSSTPKLARGTQPVDSSFDSSALHQSGSKAVQSRVVGLNEQIVKRKTELAELLRSAGKKRFKKNEPGEDVSLGDLQQGFPEMDSDPEAADNNDQTDEQAMFAGLKGSLLNDSTSFMQSPITGEADSVVFSPVTGGFTDANNYFANGEEFITGTAHELHMEQEQLQEADDALDEQQLQEEEEGVSGPVVGQYATTTTATTSSTAEEEPMLDQSRISAFDTVLEYVVDGPMSGETPRWPNSSSNEGSGVDGGDGFEGNRVAKTLVFPDMQKPVGAPKAALTATHPPATVAGFPAGGAGSSGGAGGVQDGIFTPIHRPASFLGAPFAAPALQTAFLSGVGGGEGEQVARRTSPLAGSGSAEHKSSHPFVPPSNTNIDHKNHSEAKTPATTTHTTTHTNPNPHVQEEMDLSMSALYPENQTLVNFSSSGPVYSHSYTHTHAHNSSFSSSNSLGYRDSLLHQLKVTTAKNEMLQGKLRDIEELVDRNYGSISERSKLLTAERNKLERQRTLLDDELVATKEELLFIRAQLQNKSARITELETELLEAQRMLVEPGSDSENDARTDAGGGATDGQNSGRDSDFVSPEKTFGADRALLSPEASASSMHLARSPAEVLAAEEESAREIELLGGLLVEQEQQLLEAADNRAKLADLQDKYQTTLDENFQLASYVEAAEKKSEELGGRVAELEDQVRLAEELAFEFEARAAALELEMFKKMDEDHTRAIQQAREAEKTQSVPSNSSALATPKAQQRGGDVNTLVYNSSPSLPLLLRPSAPPRVPREGYAALLIVIALLQAVIWGLVLFGGLLYLGMLELRFGIDIVRDGGVYEQLFLLKGVSAIAHTVTQSIGADLDLSFFSLSNVANVDITQGLQHFAGAAQEVVTGAAASANELFEQGLQLIR